MTIHTDNKETLQNALKRIAELEQENAELKENLETKEKVNREMLTPALDRNIKRLIEAKDIIKGLLSCARNYPEGNLKKMQRAENFLKE